MKVILHLVWATGLRVGEVANLQHNDIENNMIKVRGKVKTINSTREIPIPLELYKILKGIKNRSLYLFTDKKGNKINSQAISKNFSKLCEKLGYNYRFHAIRHTHATLLSENGIAPKGIQARLGHHSAKFSLDVYTHTTENTQKGIADIEVFKKI